MIVLRENHNNTNKLTCTLKLSRKDWICSRVRWFIREFAFTRLIETYTRLQIIGKEENTSHLECKTCKNDYSTPISKKININDIQTADLIRQKNGHHLLFVIEKIGDKVIFVDSSLKGRGVRYGEFEITDKTFPNDGVFRLNLS